MQSQEYLTFRIKASDRRRDAVGIPESGHSRGIVREYPLPNQLVGIAGSGYFRQWAFPPVGIPDVNQ